eukprot:CAMPEP_0194161614 /NCGR_PEP_ID=MMETSP0152-20130528/79040_1 /TAXON_ID=1049557 /ORGANISM="Thalassiothrix antarctica, Strain L6-D1" /LENGTH=299 /DNA_ID=CAMNT_0038871421 /DNA_START=37 /DNA_END=936 /DNA_ORIENTATION=-
MAMVEALSGNSERGGSCVLWKNIFPPRNFDPNRSTADFYGASEGFVGEHVEIRKGLDYDYHTNYTHDRQRFQDDLIRQNVLLDGGGTDRPLLVHTCGPMGAGKGHVLGWMSANGIISLERVSKIDPDTFKLLLPEWPLYDAESAGTWTHAESSYIAEIASQVAMNNRMNVWVDGSLRNYEWYEKHFESIRRKWPEYRIAILAIDASRDVIRDRLQRRATQTGRHVPEELFHESSRGIDEGLRRLIPKIDLIAHIHNSNDDDDTTTTAVEPKLSALSIIDHSGNWDLIKNLVSHDNEREG